MPDIQIEDITPSTQESTDRFLVRRGAGPDDHTMELVEVTDAIAGGASGFMSGTDKTKLDGIASGATAYTDEQAQDAVGGMVDGSLTYVDGTPLLQRSALTGAITASAGSNTTALGSFTLAEFNAALSDANLAASVITSAPSSDQADWSPSGFDTSNAVIKAQPTTNSFITGLVAGSTDQEVTIFNDSAFVMCFEAESSASTAANRFARTPYTLFLLPYQSITFVYSGSLSRWVMRSQSLPVEPGGVNAEAFIPGTGSTIQVIGRGTVITSTTISMGNPTATPTTEFQEYGYIQGSTATANGAVSMRSNFTGWMRGATANRQGFVYTARCRFTAASATAAGRAGVINTTSAQTGQNSALTHCLFLGADAGNTNLKIFMSDASAGTPVDLGANFPFPSATADYEVLFYCPPNASYARYMVKRLDTRYVAEGSITANLPGNTQALGQRVEAAVGATGATSTWQAGHSLIMGL